MRILDAVPAHQPGLLEIYNQVVADTAAIYRDDPATAEERAAWIAEAKALAGRSSPAGRNRASHGG